MFLKKWRWRIVGLNPIFTYVRTEVNYTEEVDDPTDSDGEQNSLHSHRWYRGVGNWYYRLIFTGEVLGFENLVFSIFEFVHTLLENNKFKMTVKKALPELIYYVILYMQITEDQVCNGLRSVSSSPTCSPVGLHWCRDSDYLLSSSDQSVDRQPSAVRGGRGRRHLLVLRQDLCTGPVAGEVEAICWISWMFNVVFIAR